jgi:murein DD-endopeptidase MepM/ murein hydrolase activator NlpD
VRAVYTAGPFADIEVVLDASDPGDFAERVQSVRTVVRGQQKAISELDLQRARLDASRQRLEAAQRAVAERRAQAREQRLAAQGFAADAAAQSARIRQLVASRAAALTVANREKSRTLAQLRALQAEQRRLAERLRGSGDGRGYPTGSLLWPAQGGLTQGVGPRIHPVYGYRSCHTGIDIGAASGSPIRAAAAGTVLEVTSGGPFGNRVVVQHANGLATMYAHQSRVAVSAGDRLDRGEVLGYVGSTGWSTGPHLHFEVWIAGVPYNPMGWFGGSREPVRC